MYLNRIREFKPMERYTNFNSLQNLSVYEKERYDIGNVDFIKFYKIYVTVCHI